LRAVKERIGDSSAVCDVKRASVSSGVCEFPVRVKCASLPWHTLEAAIAAKKEIVSLE